MKSNGSVPEVRLVVDSRLDNVCLIGGAIHRVARQAGFEADTSQGIELAVVEAVTNSIRHGYGNQPGRDVEVRARLHHDRLEIDICDRGSPAPPDLFDPERVRLPDGTTEGGRGAFLIISLMDEVELRSDAAGNRLRLTKRRRARRTG